MPETGLTKLNKVFVPMIQDQLEKNAIQMTPYQKVCVLGAIQKISELADENGININDISKNVSSILLTVSALELNANAEPREVYFITRNHVVGKDDHGNKIKQKQVEMGIEGDGNDALLRRFGRDVQYIHRFWEVKEDDDFTYPKHSGVDVVPPQWNPKGNANAKTVRVVYPIDFKAGKDRIVTEYFITEREQVKRNLMAHCANNLMWDKEKTTKMAKLKDFFEEHSLDEILDDQEIVNLGQISPAWAAPQARESMIVRKMRNNIVKKIPKEFSNGLMAMEFSEHADDNAENMRKDVTEQGNQELIEPDFEPVATPSSTNNAYQEQEEPETVPHREPEPKKETGRPF